MKYKFKKTCSACPEQYDVYEDDKKVAYIRYRWGHLRVNPVTSEGNIDFNTIIYEQSIGDSLDGELPDNLRHSLLCLIDNEIARYYFEIEELKEEYDRI